jgi:hypothetical protein
MSKDGFALLSLLYKIDRIPSFDIRYLSAFGGFAFWEFLISIKLASLQASGWADTCLPSVAWKAKGGHPKPETSEP